MKQTKVIYNEGQEGKEYTGEFMQECLRNISEAMQDKVLYTIGYGNRQPNELIKILKGAEIETVADVRREGSKAWCRAYWTAGTGLIGIRKLLQSEGMEVINAYEFGNVWDTLDEYRLWLESDQIFGLKSFCYYLEKYYGKTALLCAEIDPAKCHRSILADKLVKMLGDGWKVGHL